MEDIFLHILLQVLKLSRQEYEANFFVFSIYSNTDQGYEEQQIKPQE